MIAEKFNCDGEDYTAVVTEPFLNSRNIKIYKRKDAQSFQALTETKPVVQFDLTNVAYQMTMSQLRLETLIKDFEKSGKSKDHKIRREFYEIICQVHVRQDLYYREQLIKIAEGEFKNYPSEWIPEKSTFVQSHAEYDSLATLGRTHYFMYNGFDKVICSYCGESLFYGKYVMRQLIDVMSDHLHSEHKDMLYWRDRDDVHTEVADRATAS